MSRFHAQLAGALDAVAIHRSGVCSWYGRRLARMPTVALSEAAARAHIVAVLEQVLYGSFYCPGAAVPAPAEPRPPLRRDPDFVDALSSANAGRGSWESGWRVGGRADHELVVLKDGLRVAANRSETRTPGGEPEIGGRVQVRMPKELLYASPGFYTAISDIELAPEAGHTMLRLYFHVTAAGAPGLVAAITSALNGMGVAFRFKIVDAPERFKRCDAAVAIRPSRRLRQAATRAPRPALAARGRAPLAHAGLHENAETRNRPRRTSCLGRQLRRGTLPNARGRHRRGPRARNRGSGRAPDVRRTPFRLPRDRPRSAVP